MLQVRSKILRIRQARELAEMFQPAMPTSMDLQGHKDLSELYVLPGLQRQR